MSDDPGDVFARFGVPSQPALVVVHPDGTTDQLLGAVDEDVLKNVLGDPSA